MPRLKSESSCPNSLFEGVLANPVEVSLEYIALCRKYPGTANYKSIRAHVKNLVAFQWWASLHSSNVIANVLIYVRSERSPWYRSFTASLAECNSVTELENLVRGRLYDWYRGSDHTVVSPKVTSEEAQDLELGDMYDLT